MTVKGKINSFLSLKMKKTLKNKRARILLRLLI